MTLHRLYHPILFTMLCFFSTYSLAKNATELQLTGVKGAVKENVELYLQKVSLQESASSLRLQSELHAEITNALKALGYYHSDITFNVTDEADDILHIAISLGEPVRIKQVDIVIDGEAEQDAEFIALLASKAPKKGKVLHHGRYSELKTALNGLALRKGYFDAQFTLTRLEVVPDLNEAYVHLHFDSGRRYKFGNVSFNGQQIETSRLQSLVPFEAGDPYLATDLGEFNQAIATTNWFSSILVEADAERIVDYVIPIDVSLEPQKRNIIETGIGYSDDVGPRLKLNWDKPWLNSAGHSLSSKLEISAVQQSVEAAYKIPLASVATDFYQAQLGFRNVDNQDTQSRESNLVFERHWLLKSGWYRTASLRWLTEDYRQAGQSSNNNLIMPGIGFSRTRSKPANSSMAREANRILINLEVSDPSWLSDSSFIRLRSRLGWVTTLADRHRFVARADAGAVLFEDIENLPPSLRFFAGGVDNLRGYAYESVSPLNEDDKLIGGRYMATASAEYQYNVKQNWWLATFVDYGSAWTTSPDWKRGVGVGIRWVSPVGPIRLDFAFGLDKPDENAFQLHFSLGPEI